VLSLGGRNDMASTGVVVRCHTELSKLLIPAAHAASMRDAPLISKLVSMTA
jgi:hypothetical protein